MIKSRKIQLIYRSVFLLILFLGIIGSLGAYSGSFNTNFYVMYTNLSNYICFGVMIAELVFTIKALKKKEDDGTDSPITKLKFLAAIWILITFAVYNILLGDITSVSYWTSINNLTLHLICPIMFIVDFIIFTSKHSLNWLDPIWVLSFPYVYVAFILIRAAIIDHNTATVIYPYFFLNVDKYNYNGVLLWVLVLTIVFIGLGYLFCVINREPWKKKKIEIEE